MISTKYDGFFEDESLKEYYTDEEAGPIRTALQQAEEWLEEVDSPVPRGLPALLFIQRDSGGCCWSVQNRQRYLLGSSLEGNSRCRRQTRT